MKKFDEWYFPAKEQHLPEWMAKRNDRRNGRLTYQAHKYDEAMKHVTAYRAAVDVGAHIGLWSFLMAGDFGIVTSFEPVAAHRECFEKNITAKNVKLIPYALGAHEDMVAMKTRTKNSSGDTGVAGAGDIRMVKLDSLSLKLADLMKIDCEGFELAVLEGSVETIKRCRPVVVVEQKGSMSLDYGFPSLAAVKLLTELGMKEKSCVSGDYIMAWQ